MNLRYHHNNIPFRFRLGISTYLHFLLVFITSITINQDISSCEAAFTPYISLNSPIINRQFIRQSQRFADSFSHKNDRDREETTSSLRLLKRNNYWISQEKNERYNSSPSTLEKRVNYWPNYSSFSCQFSRLNAAISSTDDKVKQESDTNPYTIQSYSHKGGWDKVTYLYQPATPGYENAPPLVFIHPVGIGISSWFWTRVMKSIKEEWSSSSPSLSQGHPAIYAVDLLGCGLENGADAWDPSEKGLFFPLSWVEAVETFIQSEVLPNKEYRTSFSAEFLTNLFGNGDTSSKDNDDGCVVIVQGGLAPIGVMLASRNPTNIVSKLILTSPPIWKDMTTAIPQGELERNYNFLRSKPWGSLAFALLESRQAVQLFSNLFLFSNDCDEEWLELTALGAKDPSGRTPIQAFNAGLCNHRSFEMEMKSIEQPTLVVGGCDDKRQELRQSYGEEMKNCQLVRMDEGQNVIPWENPGALVRVIQEFISK